MASEGLSFKIRGRTDNTQKPFWQPSEHYHEDPDLYRQGGYCPISLYKELKDKRYSIEYKLGFGASATVWLARDNHSPKNCHVALKVLTADATTTSSEAQLLRTVAASPGAPSGSTYVANILDEFEVVSANGNHRVLVLPVTRSVMSLSNQEVPFRSVVKSLLNGLSSVHSAGIVHGDIHTGNIGYLFDLPYPSQYLPPELLPLPGGNNLDKPEYLVSSEQWEERPDTFTWQQITGRYIPIILDFGNAYRLSETASLEDKPKSVPAHYIPPEHVFDDPKLLNQKTDIWALGASIYEIGTDNCLSGSGSERKPSLLRIDNRLAPGWDAMPSSETATCEFWTRSFKRIKAEAKDVGDEQLFRDFFLSMVALDPNNRLSAEDLLGHPYLSKVPLCSDIS